MIDLLAEARDRLPNTIEPAAYAAVSSATDIRRLADGIERIAAHLTLPQGMESTPGETTGTVTSSPSPAEPEPGWECPACRYQGPQALTESSLVLLDRTEEAVAALIEWRKVDRLYPPEAPEAWPALLRLRDVADRIGGAA